MFSSALLFSSTVSSRSPQTGKMLFFPAVTLSGDNHLLLTVPHGQSGLKLPHGGVKQKYVSQQDVHLQHRHFQHETLSPAGLVIGLQQQRTALAEFKSVDCECPRTNVSKYPGPGPAVSLPQRYKSPLDDFCPFHQRGIKGQICKHSLHPIEPRGAIINHNHLHSLKSKPCRRQIFSK